MEKLAANKGIDTLVQSALSKLENEYKDRDLARIWIDFLRLYSQFFAKLPNFEKRYFKEERVDLIIKIITKKFDSRTAPAKSTSDAKDDDQQQVPAAQDADDSLIIQPMESLNQLNSIPPPPVLYEGILINNGAIPLPPEPFGKPPGLAAPKTAKPTNETPEYAK